MSSPVQILWWGPAPRPGNQEHFAQKAWTVLHNPPVDGLSPGLLAATRFAVIHYPVADDVLAGVHKSLSKLIIHGLLVLFVGADSSKVRTDVLAAISKSYPWDDSVRFLPHLKGINFDTLIEYRPSKRLGGCKIQQIGPFESLPPEDVVLVGRAFNGAEEVHLRELKSGRSGSKVFLAYEKRPDPGESIAYWRQPRLLKVGERGTLKKETEQIEAVSPFVPFELRPNLETTVEGFGRALYVADFVEMSESLLDAARNGRADAAISNLFYRTLGRWRERGRQCPPVHGSLIRAAERMEMMKPWIQKEYLESTRIQLTGFDFIAAWEELAELEFDYRAATIHGDLHGENVRVRGDDAILIDLGNVKGDTIAGQGAPLCFDVAMLEVALVFEYRGEQDGDNVFKQPEWEGEVTPFYDLQAILRSPSIDAAPKPASWLPGCLQRIRAFGVYDQSASLEYPTALVIAMLRWCKFASAGEADKGRRVVALELASQLIQQILKEKHATK